MALEGSLRDLALPEILGMVSRQRRTGILTIQGEEDIVAVSFLGGEVVAADALNQSFEEGLSEVLAGEGLMRPAEFQAVVSATHQQGVRLIDVLVQGEHLDREQLLEALRLQTYQLLVRLLRWRAGEFKFYAGDEVAYEEGFRALPVEEVLIRAARELGPEGPLGGPPPEPAAVYERVPEGEGGARPAGVHGGIGPEERLVLERLSGRRPAAELVADTALPEFKLLYVLHRLERSGLIRPCAPAAVEPPPLVLQEVPEPAPPPALHVAQPATALPPETRAPLAWAGPALAGAFALALAWILVTAPGRLFLPFPWQGAEREGLEKVQRAALYLRLDRAAKTYYLLEGRFPGELERLVDLRLLAPDDLRDPAGRTIAYSSGQTSYQVAPVAGGQAVAELGQTEAVTGNFLLDPDFVELPPQVTESPPLVLLD